MATRKKTVPAKGRDVDAPVRMVDWHGRKFPMRFDNRMARIVEDVYAQEYRHPEMGYYDVLGEIGVPKHRALMAMAYAAIVSGGVDIEFGVFEMEFRITDIEGMQEAIQGAVMESLPKGEDGDEKNAETTPAEA